MSELTLADLLGEIRTVHHNLTKLDVRITEVQASLAEFRLSTAERFEDLSRRLTTLFDELAAFRAEYNQHEHGDMP